MPRKFYVTAIATVAVGPAVAGAHPGPRVWIGTAAGTLVTDASDNDLAPTTYAPGRVFVGGVDQDSLEANGRLDDYPVPGTGLMATDFPAYQVRLDRQGDAAGGGAAYGTTFGFNLVGPLLVFRDARPATGIASGSFVTSSQSFAAAGTVPQIALTAEGDTSGSADQPQGGLVTTANGPVPGFDFYAYNSPTDHGHNVAVMLPDGTFPGDGSTPGDGPHAVYAVPIQLTAAGLYHSAPFYVLYGDGIGSLSDGPDQQTFLDAVAVANAALAAPKLTWNNAAGSGDGKTWDAYVNQNWTTGAIPAAYADAAAVTLNDANNGHYAVTLSSTVEPASVAVSAAGDYTLGGPGAIVGKGSLTKTGGGTLVLANGGANTYSGGTVIMAGVLKLSAGTTLGSGTVAVSGTGLLSLSAGATASATPVYFAGLSVTGGKVVAAFTGTGSGRTVVLTPSLAVAGGQIDLTDNDLVVQGGDLVSVTAAVAAGYRGGRWDANGIVSTTAAADGLHVTTLGTAVDAAVGSYTQIDGVPVAGGDVLVRYTYFGDANLDGKVDGSDYARIDNGFSKRLTGWTNGDFNYDGVVDASDYTLIDNAFNSQRSALGSPAALFAAATTEAAAIPEPAALALFAVMVPLLRRCRRGKTTHSLQCRR